METTSHTNQHLLKRDSIFCPLCKQNIEFGEVAEEQVQGKPPLDETYPPGQKFQCLQYIKGNADELVIIQSWGVVSVRTADEKPVVYNCYMGHHWIHFIHRKGNKRTFLGRIEENQNGRGIIQSDHGRQ